MSARRTREPKFLTAMRNRGVVVRLVGRISYGKRDKRYVVWQLGPRGWDAVLYTAAGRSVNTINFGLKGTPTQLDSDNAFAQFVAALNIEGR